MYIYAVVSKTPTIVGKVIRQVLDNKYNHMSLSLEPDLSKMFSFGRVTVKNFLSSGPIRESYYTMSLGGEAEVDICVFRLPVTKKQYERLSEFISSVYYDVDGYVYNLADAIGTIFHRRIRVDKCYTCIEFCKDALSYAEIDAAKDLESVSTLDGVRSHLKHFMIYEGNYIKYPGVFLEKTENDIRFLQSHGLYTEIRYTAGTLKKFIGRVYHTKVRVDNSRKK